MTEYIIDATDAVIGDDFDARAWFGPRLREEIVRCRDCVHCMSYWQSDYCDYFSHVTNNPDGFCAWGERRQP